MSVKLVQSTIWTTRNERISYIDNWNDFFNAMTNEQKEFENAIYNDASTFLSDKNPPTFINFCETLLNTVPPLHNIHTLSKSHPRSTVTIETRSVTICLKRSIFSTHKDLPNLKSTPLSISTPDASYCHKSFDDDNADDTQNLIFSPPTYPSSIRNVSRNNSSSLINQVDILDKKIDRFFKSEQSTILTTLKSTIQASLDGY